MTDTTDDTAPVPARLTVTEIAAIITDHVIISHTTMEAAKGGALIGGIVVAARSIGERIGDELTEARRLEESFDLRWKADMRAIKMWQQKTGRIHTWPDHADLCVFLLDELDRMTGDGSHRP
jgi:hypothetical protein